MLQIALSVVEILISVTVITIIVLQSKGSGFGGIFGGRDMLNPLHTRRGLEKTLFQATIVLVVIFLLISLASSMFVSY